VQGVDFGLLGPLVVWDGARHVAVSAPRQRVLLAALLLEADRVVSLDSLAAALWDDDPPAGARGAMHSAIQRLRSALGPGGFTLIETRPPGYRIRLAECELDIRRFGALTAGGQAAAEAGGWAQAAELMTEALGLWRGEPLADIPSQVLQDRERARLEDERLQALATRIDADLQLGRYGQVVPELRELVAAYPLREQRHDATGGDTGDRGGPGGCAAGTARRLHAGRRKNRG
jgi:DNA-binding SARP family transcriptional activator